MSRDRISCSLFFFVLFFSICVSWYKQDNIYSKKPHTDRGKPYCDTFIVTHCKSVLGVVSSAKMPQHKAKRSIFCECSAIGFTCRRRHFSVIIACEIQRDWGYWWWYSRCQDGYINIISIIERHWHLNFMYSCNFAVLDHQIYCFQEKAKGTKFN